MGVKRNVHQPVGSAFPGDFPERLERFRDALNYSRERVIRCDHGAQTWRGVPHAAAFVRQP